MTLNSMSFPLSQVPLVIIFYQGVRTSAYKQSCAKSKQRMEREETDGQRGIEIVERQGQTEPVREGEREIITIIIQASLPVRNGGLGIRSAVRLATSAFWHQREERERDRHRRRERDRERQREKLCLRNPGRINSNPGSAHNCPGVATPLTLGQGSMMNSFKKRSGD